MGQIWTNTQKISNMKEACLRNLSYVFMKGKMLVKHNTKIFHRRCRCYRGIRRYAEAYIIQLLKLSRCAEQHKFSLRRSEEHTSELQSRGHLVCRLLLE